MVFVNARSHSVITISVISTHGLFALLVRVRGGERGGGERGGGEGGGSAGISCCSTSGLLDLILTRRVGRKNDLSVFFSFFVFSFLFAIGDAVGEGVGEGMGE